MMQCNAMSVMLRRRMINVSDHAQKRMRSVVPETEQDASIAYNLRTPVVSSVINERSQNKWGISQGYRIQVHIQHQVSGYSLKAGLADCMTHIHMVT